MNTLQHLSFGPDCMEPVIEGSKNLTIRKFRPEAHDLKKGQTIVGEFAEGLHILLTVQEDTATKSFKDLTDAEAWRSGFENAKDAFKGLSEIYENLSPDDTAALIFIKVYEVEGVSVVQLPPEVDE